MEQKRGVTGLIVPVQFNDTTSVIGGGKTGLTFATSGLICYYKRELDTQTRAVTLQTMTLGTWASGGFVEVDVTHDPGGYELGLPNAAVGTSDASRWVKITLMGASGAYAPPLRIDLNAVDFQDSVRLGLTALPNATAGASGGLPVVDSNLSLLANAILRGTASAGGSNTITLAGGSATDNLYKYALCQIISGTGAGQARLIIDYVGSTKVATVNKGWTTTPDNTSVFALLPWTTPTVVHSGIAQAGGATSITLQSIASASDNVYTQHVITLFTGTGAFQSRIITAYNGTTKVATVDSAWAVNPDSTSVYEISAVGPAWADVFQWNGTAVATPAAAGIPDVNAKNINNVATTAVTAVNANQGTTQPINFTGTAASALTKADVVDIAGTASQGAAGYVGTDQSKIANPTAAVDLSGTTIKNVDNAIASVTTVGSVSGNVGGNVTGSVGSLAAQAQTDVQTALTTQGYTPTRAGYLDTLNGLVAAIFDYLTTSVTTAGSWAKYVSDTLASILSRTSTSGGPFVSPVADDGITTIIYVSRDYNAADGWALIYPTSQTVYNTDTFAWSVGPFGSPYLEKVGTYYDASHIQVELTAAQTGSLGRYIGQSLDLEIRTTRSGRKIEQVRGKALITGVVNP